MNQMYRLFQRLFQSTFGMLYGICTYIDSIKINHSWNGKHTVRPMDPSGVLSKSRGNDDKTVTHDICARDC